MATKDQSKSLLSPADIEILTRHYDTNKDGILSEEEIRNLIAEVKIMMAVSTKQSLKSLTVICPVLLTRMLGIWPIQLGQLGFSDT